MLEPSVAGEDVEMSAETVIATVIVPALAAQHAAILRLAREIDRLSGD